MYWKISSIFMVLVFSLLFALGFFNSNSLNNKNYLNDTFNSEDQNLTKEQQSNSRLAEKIAHKGNPILAKYKKLREPKEPKKWIYDFEITADTFKNAFEALYYLALSYNENGFVNRSKLILNKLEELLDDYPALFTVWKGPNDNALTSCPQTIAGNFVLVPIEVLWCLKVVFAICSLGDSPLSILENFSKMIKYIKEYEDEKAQECANKINLKGIELKYLIHIANNFETISKIIDVNLEKGFLNREHIAQMGKEK